ncbi:MAG: DUF222 domain-containing protein, partial [Pseudomonadales bacterium]|nr:DUF222 domain-containing protein [Pseudomonadales bacterium]
MAHINAQEYLFLCDVREFDLRQGWAAHHMNNCAEWLAWRCQISLTTCREKVRVAHQLFGLPLVSEAFREGRISYSKARALTRIAGPDDEKELLDYALSHAIDKVERHCRALRNARRELSREDANSVFKARYLSGTAHDDGSMTISAELPREMGELVMKAIEIAMKADDTEDHDTSVDPATWSARRADALVNIAQDYLAGGTDKPARKGDNYSVIVHVDEAALAGRDGESDLPIETVRRITCDASIATVVKDKHGNPVNAGRKHRIVPPAIRRAVLARDRSCRFPGCAHTQFLEPHHIIHWADGGKTNVDELIALCSRHHRRHHEGGYTIHKLADGQFVFRNADGRLIPEAPPYRPEYKDDIDDETYHAFVEQLAARHASTEVYEENSSRVQDQEQGSYASAEAFGNADHVREPMLDYMTWKRNGVGWVSEASAFCG